MAYCKHLMSYCKRITDRGTKSAWFTKCVGCKTRWIYSSDMYECTECQVLVHKCCWIFGQCCVLEASDKRSATITASVEVSEDAGPPEARNTVENCDVSTETIAYLVEGSMQTDVLDRCHASSQTDTTDLKYDHQTSFTDGVHRSVVPPRDVSICEIIDKKPVVSQIGTVDVESSSFPAGGSRTADTDISPHLLCADCASSSRTEFTGKIPLTLKQRMRKIQVEKATVLKVKTDAVSALQELCLARGWMVPEYHSWIETIENRFEVHCSVIGYTVKGEGISKKEAKHRAAYEAFMAVKNRN